MNASLGERAASGEASLLDRLVASHGAAGARDVLREMPLRSFVELPLPDEWQQASVYDALGWIWALHGRPSQLVSLDGPRKITLLRSGRGWGKSRTLAETVNLAAQRLAMHVQRGDVAAPARIILCSRSSADTHDIIIGGANGVVARSAPWFRARHEPSHRRVIWEGGLVEAITYSAAEPSQTRGPDACFAACDEWAAWGAGLEECWTNIQLATRIGPLATKHLITTTPRAHAAMKALVQRPDVLDVKRPTADNAKNLADGIVDGFHARFAGALAAQELGGEIVDVGEASWFPRENATILSGPPDDVVARIRAWDLAGTKPSEATPDPDWTCGTLLGRRRNGRLVVIHAALLRDGPGAVEDLVGRTAALDTRSVPVLLPQDPGSAGKSALASLARRLLGFRVLSERPTGSKEARAAGLSAQWLHGNVDVVRGAWNEEFLSQMSGFPSGYQHDDAVDASASGFNQLAENTPLIGIPW